MILRAWVVYYSKRIDEARNTTGFLSHIHAEIEIFILAMERMKTQKKIHVIFATYCSHLVKIVSKVGEWSVFATYLQKIQGRLKEIFKTIELKHVPMT